MSAAGGAILVTGADGYFGRLVTEELLRRTARPLWLWLHAGDEATLERRGRALRAVLPATEDPRVHICGGDLRAPAPFASLQAGPVGAIIHAAAITRFNVDAAAAQAVNVEGTAKLLAFARRCPQLGAFAQVSTLYASGLRAGGIAEELLPDQAGFANHYEASKWAAERLVAASALPWRVLRLPTLIADDDSGAFTQPNVFHNTLRLLRGGLLALLPGQASTPLCFGAGRWAARATVSLTLSPEAAGVYHLCHGPTDALALGRLLALAHESFGRDPSYRARRLLLPPLCDRDTFAEVAEAVGAVGAPLLAQALASITPFAPQLFVDKHIDNRRLRAAVPEAPPGALPLVRATLETMVRGRP